MSFNVSFDAVIPAVPEHVAQVEAIHGSTYNLVPMHEMSGWWPIPDGMTVAELRAKLEVALADMKRRPEEYKKLDSPNGWGVYADAIEVVETLIAKCIEFPNGTVKVDG